jgi:hypothetical protein
MKLVIGFSTLLMVSALAGCSADTTIATASGSGGSQGTGGISGGSGGSGDVDGSVDLNRGSGGSTADVRPIDNTTCCPRDLTMSGCMHLGGSSDQAFGCTLMCEFYCSENWHVVEDQHGCESWVFSIRQPVASEDLHCMSGRDAGPSVDTSADVDAGTDVDATIDVNAADASTDG